MPPNEVFEHLFGPVIAAKCASLHVHLCGSPTPNSQSENLGIGGFDPSRVLF